MKRHHLVLGFQNDPTVSVCLLSLLAGAEGITLTVSRKLYPLIERRRGEGRGYKYKCHNLTLHIYHVDPWWNPGTTFSPPSPSPLLSLLSRSLVSLVSLTFRSPVSPQLIYSLAKTQQASDRVHRIGQARNVEIVHLHVANTIEDSIHELQEKKKTVAAAVMGEAKVTEGLFLSLSSSPLFSSLLNKYYV
jgi:hypothetical protein